METEAQTEEAKTTTTVLVTSHVNNAAARSTLMESLRMFPGYEAHEIIVVVGDPSLPGYEIRYPEDEPNVIVVHAPHNSIDFTGLIAVLELRDRLKRPRYLYLHDTCTVGPDFFKYVDGIEVPDGGTASFSFPSMNMGVYSWKALETHRGIIERMKNRSAEESKAREFKALCVDLEDAVFKANRDSHVCWGGMHPTYETFGDVYGFGIQRKTEYYPSLDLYKHKANWFTKPEYELRL